MTLTPLPARPSGYLTTFPCPLRWLHATSLSLPSSLCLPSLTCPHIPLILFLSSITPHSLLLSLLPLPYPPPHLLTRGVYADSGTFVRVFVKIREKFCSAGSGGGGVMQPRGRARHTVPHQNTPFINRHVLSLITSP